MIVVRTTAAETIAALKAAVRLAAGLGADISLLAIEEVPLHFPVERLAIPTTLIERRLKDLIADAGVREQEVLIQLLFCRNKHIGLQQALDPGDLIVIGASNAWWSRRRSHLEQFLIRLGVKVVVAEIASRKMSRRRFNL